MVLKNQVSQQLPWCIIVACNPFSYFWPDSEMPQTLNVCVCVRVWERERERHRERENLIQSFVLVFNKSLWREYIMTSCTLCLDFEKRRNLFKSQESILKSPFLRRCQLWFFLKKTDDSWYTFDCVYQACALYFVDSKGISIIYW